MVTEALSVVAPGVALAWPAPMLPALGLAGAAGSADRDAPGDVAVPLPGWLSDEQAETHSKAARPMTAQDPFNAARPRCWWSLARSHGFQLVQRLLDELWQILLACFADPEPESDLEDRDPRLRGEAGGRFTDAPLAQRASERRGE